MPASLSCRAPAAPRYGELDGWFGRVHLALGEAAAATGAAEAEYAESFDRAIAFLPIPEIPMLSYSKSSSSSVSADRPLKVRPPASAEISTRVSSCTSPARIIPASGSCT